MKYWPFLLVLGIVFIGCAMMYESDDSDAATVVGSGTQADPYTYLECGLSELEYGDLGTYISQYAYIYLYYQEIDEGIFSAIGCTGNGIAVSDYDIFGYARSQGTLTVTVEHTDCYAHADHTDTYSFTVVPSNNIKGSGTSADPYTKFDTTAGLAYEVLGNSSSVPDYFKEGSFVRIESGPHTDGYEYNVTSVTSGRGLTQNGGSVSGTLSGAGSMSLTIRLADQYDQDYTTFGLYVLAQYTVAWNNWDGTRLETDYNVLEGTTPTYNSATPTRPATAQYTYTFTGWSPTVGPISGNTTYTAQYSATTNNYTVTWKNWDNTTLETDYNVAYGSTPSYNSATPTKPATAQYTYTFTGWSPTVSPITGDVTYTAQYSATLRTYTVAWNNWDGSTLETDLNVSYGTTPTYNGSTPTMPNTPQYIFIFSGWSPSVSMVTGDQTYTAQFTRTYREYTDGDWTYGILDSGYAILLGYTGSGGVVQIPITVNGLTVTNIGVALKDNESVTGVVIPSNVESIVYDAFSGTPITEVLNLSGLNITGASYGLNGATIHTSIPGWFYISDVEYTDRVPDNSTVSKLIRIIPLLILIGVIVMIARNRVEDE